MIILGAGGHASEVFDVLLGNKTDNETSLFFFDNINGLSMKFGRPVLSSVEELVSAFKIDNRCIIAVGNPNARKLLNQLATDAGGIVQQLISNTAHLSTLNTNIGEGVNIMHRAMIFPDTSIGYGALINSGAMVHHDCKIGEFCEIGPATVLTGGVQIGNNVSLGAGCVVLPGLSICDDVVIGGGTTVTKHIHEPGIYVGNPHKKLK